MARPDPASLGISASTETTDFKWEQQGVRRPKENAWELLGGTHRPSLQNKDLGTSIAVTV